MAVVLVLGSLQLIVMGIIAIYLSKIFLEVKRRPLTIVKDVFRADARSGLINSSTGLV